MNVETVGQSAAKHEDFPVNSLRHVEGKVSRIRRTLMDIAAKIAEDASPSGDSYRVEPLHIDQALVKLFREFPSFQNDIGLAD